MGRPLGSKNKSRFDGDNGGPALRDSVDGAELLALIDRVENVSAEIADLTGDRRELYKEIKAAGYDVATMRAIVKERAVDADKRRARDDLMAEYMAALGDLADTPLGQAGADRVREAAE